MYTEVQVRIMLIVLIIQSYCIPPAKELFKFVDYMAKSMQTHEHHAHNMWLPQSTQLSEMSLYAVALRFPFTGWMWPSRTCSSMTMSNCGGCYNSKSGATFGMFNKYIGMWCVRILLPMQCIMKAIGLLIYFFYICEVNHLTGLARGVPDFCVVIIVHYKVWTPKWFSNEDINI